LSRDLDLTPDSSALLYQEFNRGNATDLMVLPMHANARPEVVLKTAFDESDGRFSPDGHWVSFTSDVSGRSEVYVARFPMRGTPIRVSRAGGSMARWRGDGRELTFLGPAGEIMAAAVAPKADSLDFGAPQFLFRTSEGIASYELTADGHRFIVAANEIDPPPPVQLVLRWFHFSPLARRVVFE